MNALKLAALALLTVFAPVHAAVITVLVLCLGDLTLGLLSAWRRKEPITSVGLRRTVVKLLVYELALVAAFLTQRFLTGEIIPLAKIVATYIGLAELKSFLENLNEISGGSLLTSVIDRVVGERHQ